jgi:transcription elongation factor Elf1
VTTKVISVKQSPLNTLQWCIGLACGHDQWVTAKRRPTRKTLRCNRCRTLAQSGYLNAKQTRSCAMSELWPDGLDLKAILDRKDFVCSHVPHCPKCGEQMQIQIKRFDPPALWRCRMCKHHFEHEPSTDAAQTD